MLESVEFDMGMSGNQMLSKSAMKLKKHCKYDTNEFEKNNL